MKRSGRPSITWPKATLACISIGIVAAGGLFLASELVTSRLQATLFTRLANEAKYWMEPGRASSVHLARVGPYDSRLGYAELPDFVNRLESRNYAIVEQARVSPAFLATVNFGLFPPYREKSQAGLTVADCKGDIMFSARYPERVYPTFDTVPRVLVDTLLFIENKELLSNSSPTRNPAIEWNRFAKAVLDQVMSVFHLGRNVHGGSTLATQIEKYRHSPEGRTSSGFEKLRQMASASLRSYIEGEETFAARRRIVLDYINTVPLSARAGYGEVSGLADGLWVWYGRDHRAVSELLSDTSPADLDTRALAYKQAVSLFISQRRPTYFLTARPDALENHTDRYLRLLADGGVISKELMEAALRQPLELSDDEDALTGRYAVRKAANSVRNSLATMLGRPLLYDIDRLDLTVSSTLDMQLQESVTNLLTDLTDPEKAKEAGLVGPRMLDQGNPTRVVYSFTLFERTPEANVVRVQADNLAQPLDINENTKLDLGSTAKLRTLVTYLEIIADFHRRYGEVPVKQLRKLAAEQDHDALARWSLEYLAQTKDRNLEAMLEAALERRYSASPYESFFTAGGVHQFENFDKNDNQRVLTVREALRRSVNLVFIRLMRDVVRHEVASLPGGNFELLADRDAPGRTEYLARFADKEGSQFLKRFYRTYSGRSVAEALDRAASGVRPNPRRLAVIFRSVVPQASSEEMAAYVKRHLPDADLSGDELQKLYSDYGSEKFSLADRAYLSNVHPLQLWLMSFLRNHPKATLTETLAASKDERQAAYAWLFKPRKKGSQDMRIKILLEADAFQEIHAKWKRLGYPFDSLVPSYATALGTSADRPAALAELMGILVNDGVRLPTVRIQSLQFAKGTPYETLLEHMPSAGERVLPQEVARVTRRVLMEVVEAGTARRLKGAFKQADGTFLQAGGKTGTGDHRFQTFGKGGRILSSKVVGRSGTFVFYAGDRYFGTLTAHVRGPEAGNYHFTSGLPVQILKVLAPTLTRVMDRSVPQPMACRSRAHSLIARNRATETIEPIKSASEVKGGS